MESVNVILPVVFALMIVTNIITEVVKKLTWDKIPTNLMVIIVSEALTLISGAVYGQVNGINIVWYHVVGAVIVGIFVAYAAMFGFDKLQQTLTQIQKK